MSIGDFVNDSILLLKNGRYESAMCIAMNAMDATAKLEYPDLSKPGNVGERNLRFVRDNYDSISVVGTGGAIYSAPGSHLNLPDPKTAGTSSLEDILYIVRCQLTHEAVLPTDTFFNEQAVFGRIHTGFSIPINFIYAVLLAVVGAKANTNVNSRPGDVLIFRGKLIPITECWGCKDKITSLLGI
jgi:hypothetical protein